MLEYLAYKKYKQRKQKSAEVQGEAALGPAPKTGNGSTAGKGKGAEVEFEAISAQDERFLEKSLSDTSAAETPATTRSRLIQLTDQWSSFRPRRHTLTDGENSADSAGTTTSAIQGQTRPGDVEDEFLLNEELLEDEEMQRTRLQKLMDAFAMHMTTARPDPLTQPQAGRTMTERMNRTFGVSTLNEKTRALMSEFLQILKDIQNGVPLAGEDLMRFFDRHAGDLKTANESVPSFVKALVWKLLPLSAVPSIEELGKPGALTGLIKGVLQVLKTRFPAFVGGSALMIMAVAIVMLGLFYAFKRGREEREAHEETPFSRVSVPAVSGLGQGRQVEIGVDGVRYVTILDEDGMRIPCPEDERGVYWDQKA